MSDLNDISIRVEKYLDGKLSIEEKDLFEKELSTNTELAQELELEKTVRATVIDDALLDWKAAIGQEMTVNKTRVAKTSFYKRLFIGLIGGVLGVLVVFTLRTKDKIEQIKDTPALIKNTNEQVLEEEKGNLTSDSIASRGVELKESKPLVNSETVQVVEEAVDSDGNVEEDQQPDVEVVPLEQEAVKEIESSESIPPMPVNPCHDITITATVSTVPTCEGEQKGQLLIKSVKGGLFPYQYKLGSGDWNTSPVFDRLSDGIYDVFVRDENGCESLLEEAEVESIYCYKPEGAFNPDYETWEYRSEDGKELTISIFNKRGQVIAKGEFDNTFVWDGRDLQGSKVALGLYKYIVKSDTDQLTGSVSVIY